MSSRYTSKQLQMTCLEPPVRPAVAKGGAARFALRRRECPASIAVGCAIRRPLSRRRGALHGGNRLRPAHAGFTFAAVPDSTRWVVQRELGGRGLRGGFGARSFAAGLQHYLCTGAARPARVRLAYGKRGSQWRSRCISSRGLVRWSSVPTPAGGARHQSLAGGVFLNLHGGVFELAV